jgi:hypothetical protein
MIIGMGIIAVPAGLVASALTKAKEMEGWVTFLYFFRQMNASTGVTQGLNEVHWLVAKDP